MHNDASASGASSAETSRAAAAPTESEAEFLARQAAEAQAAMGAALGEFGQNLDQAWREATDVRGWIERHPWLALGAAAAAGYAAGMTLAPGSPSSASAARSDRPEPFDGEEQAERARPSRLSSLIPWEMLIGPMTELARTLVENLFAAFIASRAAAQAAAAATPAATSPDRDAQCAASSPEPASPLDDPTVELASEA